MPVFPAALASRLALNLDIVELDVHGFGLGFGDFVGKLQRLHHGLDGVLVLLDIVDAHVHAATVNVGEVLGRHAARVRKVGAVPGLAVVLNGIALGPSGVGLPLCLVVEQFIGVLVRIEDGDEAVTGVLALGELKLGPVGGIACDVRDFDALGHLDFKPNVVSPHIHGWLFCSAATAASGSAAAATATHQGNCGKETDAEGENRKGLLFHGRVLLDLQPPMDYLSLLYAREARSSGPCVPF